MIKLIISLYCILLPSLAFAAPVKIKDLVNFEGVRKNDLIGYGLVTGLNGTGDSLRNSPFTEEALSGTLERLGVNVTDDAIRSKNVAAVIVTATLPEFARNGSQVDIAVSSIGDAKSLLGGTLLMTPLSAADGEVYAVAQGAVLSGGIDASGESARVSLGVPTTGSVPNGARIEREIAFELSSMRQFRISLRSPDFSTAARIEAAINNEIRSGVAQLLDSGTISIDLARSGRSNPAHLMGMIENIRVEPDTPARVVIDHKSGTIIMGQNVRISKVAISQGNLSLRVRESPMVSQPNPFSLGESIILPRSQAEITQEPGIGFAEVNGEASLSDVIVGLNSLGVRPRDLIDILKSIHSAGALHADLIVN
ncbi:flagellar basal body P-ring protein FlgI [Paracoccus sp. (in: a-proteobacteria)]|uniref:flagellar basal body P-ring protein FlgI n=1 Tax=Paracoccus sp. TaxID=267 RepID=UPI0028A0FB67|nr:flagellar basal body P-ring protein FlgI [Paracoccus sp. (in: a-proteobacteria)]